MNLFVLDNTIAVYKKTANKIAANIVSLKLIHSVK